MAQKRDMFDDIIDITKGLSGITEPFSDLTNVFLGNPEPRSASGIRQTTRRSRGPTPSRALHAGRLRARAGHA